MIASMTMQPAPFECKERTVLEGRAQANLRVYILAVGTLGAMMNPKEFEQTYENAERSKWMYEQSRDDLKLHIAMHGC